MNKSFLSDVEREGIKKRIQFFEISFCPSLEAHRGTRFVPLFQVEHSYGMGMSNLVEKPVLFKTYMRWESDHNFENLAPPSF